MRKTMMKVHYGRYNRQYAVIYIVYMMASSYFHKCICRNKQLEDIFYLNYVEMPEKQKLEKENRVLKILDGMDASLQRSLADLNCEAYISQTGDDYKLSFQTGGFGGLEVSVDSKGRYQIMPTAA